MTNLSKYHTPKFLLEALLQKHGEKPSQAEIFEQRVSFVYGSLDSDGSVTREQVKRFLADSDVGAIAIAR